MEVRELSLSLEMDPNEHRPDSIDFSAEDRSKAVVRNEAKDRSEAVVSTKDPKFIMENRDEALVSNSLKTSTMIRAEDFVSDHVASGTRGRFLGVDDFGASVSGHAASETWHRTHALDDSIAPTPVRVALSQGNDPMSRLHDGFGAEASGTQHRFLGTDEVGATALDCMASGRGNDLTSLVVPDGDPYDLFNGVDPRLLPGGAGFSSSSSFSSSRDLESSDVKDTSARVDVEEAKKTKKKKKPMVRLDPLGSSLSTAESLDALRARCGIPEKIVFVVPTLYAKQDNNDWDAKVAQLRSRLSTAYTRVVEVVGAAREDMTRGIEGRVSRAVEVLQGKKVPKLEDEVKRLRGQQDESYEDRDVFRELFADVKEVIGIPDAASDIYVAHAEQVSEVVGTFATETTPPESFDGADIDVEGVVPEEG
ncbi:hypothetical protein AALP_AAs75038U000200 [Arabis alpina]|uniref:Uncharacterized protein n=1 Tax=Arabis alpina TaxID=50452 RepID=A0A087FYH1_ARAAL|nr:hypothetical protein AALP_AAs75038U000200 [Arabis alpina]